MSGGTAQNATTLIRRAKLGPGVNEYYFRPCRSPASARNDRGLKMMIAKILGRLAQPFAERNLRLPTQHPFRLGDVRLPALGIVLGQRLVDERRSAAHPALHLLSKFRDRQLLGIAQIHRIALV